MTVSHNYGTEYRSMYVDICMHKKDEKNTIYVHLCIHSDFLEGVVF